MAETYKEHIKVSYSEVHKLVEKGCAKVIEDRYVPDALIGISSGGLMPVKIAKTFIEDAFKLNDIPIYIIGIANYDYNDNQLSEPIMTQKFDSELEKKLNGKSVLLVDEVDDSRRTLEKATNYLLSLNIKELRILVLHQKDKEKKGLIPEGVKLYYSEKIPPKWVEYQWSFKEVFDELK